MKRRYRLLKKVDFQRVLRIGDRFYSRNFVCYYLPEFDLINVKIGIIIPKKKCKLSNKRKYLKRLFWALNTKNQLNLFPRIKCVIMYRDFFYSRFADGDFSFSELKDEYLSLMENISKKSK